MSNVGYGLSICIRFKDPQPEYSAFREASYGHSTLEIKNRTHAFYHWNRNDDGKKVATDEFILHNQYWLVHFYVIIFLIIIQFSNFREKNKRINGHTRKKKEKKKKTKERKKDGKPHKMRETKVRVPSQVK